MSTIRKFVAILIISLTLVIGLHFSLKKILFTDKSAIETALSQHLKCAVKISGNIEFFLLPLPFIKIENILFSDNNWDLVKAHELILHPKLSSIFRGNISLNDIKQIDFETALFDFWSLNVYYKNLLATQENKIDYIPVININNSTIIIHKQKEFASNIYKFNSFINVSDDILKSDSTFFFEHVDYGLKLSLDRIFDDDIIQNLFIKIHNEHLALEINSKIKNLFKAPAGNGSVGLYIINQKNINDGSADRTSENFMVHGIFRVKDGLINITDVTTPSKEIKNLSSDINIYFSDRIEVGCIIKADYVDFDALIKQYNHDAVTIKERNLESYVRTIIEDIEFQLPHSILSTFNLDVLEGNLLGDKITNIVFDVDVFFGNAALNKIRLIAPGNTSITLQGVVTHNAIRSKFDGSLFVASDDLSLLKSWLKVNTNSLKDSKKLLLLSDIAFLANRIKLDNAKAAIDKTTMFGRATFMNDFHKNLEINSSLKFASLDADALSLDKLFDNAIKVLYTSDPDKTSQTYFELVNDHAELRGLNKTVNLEIASDNVIFKKQKFDNFNIALLAKPNFFAIQNMSATSPFLDFTADMALTIPTFKPQLSFNFYAKNCDISYVSKLFPSYTTLQTDLIKYYNDQKNNDQQKNSLIIDFNFLGAQNYNAKLNFKFDTLVYNPSVRINNINSDIVIQDGNISTYNTTAELFNGKLNASGYINVNEAVPSFALSFSLDNILPELFFSPFLNYKNIRGYMSISTSLKTLGINWQDFFSKLSGDIIVVGKQISWDSIDLNEVVKAVNMRLTPEDKLKRIDYYLANGTSFFDDLSGKFSVVNGTATTSNIVLSNGRLQGIYAASYNIASNTISTASKFAFLPIGYPNPLTIQIKSKGNIGSTKTDIDISQLSDFIMAQEKYNADKQTSNKIESSIRTLIK